jgi:hypothetical protein
MVTSIQLMLVGFAPFVHSTPVIDVRLAAQHFQEARRQSESDGGLLWGTKLYGPMLFLDPGTRQVVANQADGEGLLSEKDGVFVGSIPRSVPVANTALEWAGVLWPLPEEESNRARLMLHECFHRIQSKLGLPLSNPSNAHLDHSAGRYWLQLEYRALARALGAEEANRRDALRDALLFRGKRRGLFADAEKSENALEMNEGIAEYTGIRLSGLTRGERIELARDRLSNVEQEANFVRMFAYVTGPAYGLLLDEVNPKWREGLKPTSDLGELCRRAYDLRVSQSGLILPRDRANLYDGPALYEREKMRGRQREDRQAGHRRKFVDGPGLVLPMSSPRLSFDPGELVPLSGAGTVYPTLSMTDLWGSLTVTHGGALVLDDWSQVRVPVAGDLSDPPTSGDGWEVELNPGWEIVAEEQSPNWTVRRK